jgi:hypothetical protein
MSNLSLPESKPDKPGASNGPTAETTPGGLNADHDFAPEEIAGLREHRRQYTKELQAARTQSIKQKKMDIDPNHAYPTFGESTTLCLSELLPARIMISLTFHVQAD